MPTHLVSERVQSGEDEGHTIVAANSMILHSVMLPLKFSVTPMKNRMAGRQVLTNGCKIDVQDRLVKTLDKGCTSSKGWGW